MIARAFVALTLCPGLGILTGGWLAQQTTVLARRLQPVGADASAEAMMGMDLLYGAGAGLIVGVLFALTLIWCAGRGPGSAQRALADLLLIALGLLFVVDWVTYIGLVPDAGELWQKLLPVNAGLWLLGLMLSVVAVWRARRAPRLTEAMA